MTVITTASEITYAGNGVTAGFAVPFRFLAAADLRVVRRSAAGVETLLTINTDYTVAGVDVMTGGSILLTVPPAVGTTLIIERRTPRLQETDFPENNGFSAATLERIADASVMMVQESAGRLDRAVTVPAGEAGVSLPLVAARASRAMGFDAFGLPVAGPNIDLLTSLAAGVSPLALPAATVVTTRAAMTALLKAGLSDNRSVLCLGGATVSDGNGGLYYWNAASVAAANGTTILAANEGGTGRWLAAWLAVGDPSLRTELAGSDGAALVGNAVGSVATRTAMKAATVWAGRVLELTEGLRGGRFVAINGAIPVSDPLEGKYIASNTAGWYWSRVHAPDVSRAEWWGALPGNGGFNSTPALQASIDITNRLTLSGAGYYGANGLVGRSNTIITGEGSFESAIFISSATDHLIRFRGTASVSYLVYPVLRKFALVRTVNPTTPASEANDITQGHGLHFFMVSNPVVEDVFTTGNLVELYVSNVLTPMMRFIRGSRGGLGGAGDRWYGLYIDGVTGGGLFGGPSPNPSAHMSFINMITNSAVGRSWGALVKGPNQDLWVDFLESGGNAHVPLFVDAAGGNSGDTRFTHCALDGYRTMGAHLKNVPQGSSIELTGWVAPAAGATGDGIRIEASHGIDIKMRGDFGLATNRRMLNVSDSSLLKIKTRANNCVTAGYFISMVASNVETMAHKAIAGGGASGVIADVVGGSDNRFTLAGTVTSQKWAYAYQANATIVRNTIDVSMVPAGSVTDRIFIDPGVVTTQGNVGGHTIINPGAGAML